MAMWVSVSGGSRMIMFLPLLTDHPAGALNAAPPGVTSRVSAANRPGDDLVCSWLEGGVAVPAAIACTRTATLTTAKRTIRERTVRRVDITSHLESAKI